MRKKNERSFKLSGADSAMIFRHDKEEVEVIIPAHQGKDEIPPSIMLMLSIMDKLGTEPQFRDDLIRDFHLKHAKTGTKQ